MLKSFPDEGRGILSLLSAFWRYIYSIWKDKSHWCILWLISSEDHLTDLGFFWSKGWAAEAEGRAASKHDQTMDDAYNCRECRSGVLRCLFSTTVCRDLWIPLRKEMLLQRNKVHFKGGQCALPFLGLGEHGNRIRAGQGVEESSADLVRCCFTQASSGFLFLLFVDVTCIDFMPLH